jgi:hypothetical protein
MTQAEYIEGLRNYIKDHAALNRLLSFAAESIDDELEMYLSMALGFLNSVPPILNYVDYDSFPYPQLLIHQAAIETMISNSILSARNDLTYNNGGITVKITDGNRYLNMIQVMLKMTDREIEYWKQLKIAANINGGWGGTFSPYSRLHGRQQTLNPNTLLSG